jgi:uncharacterized protein (TIGR02001 family)
MNKYIATIALLFSSVTIAQSLDGTVGFQSEYVFRGSPISDSSAFVQADAGYERFSIGALGLDVDEGAEVDVFANYSNNIGDLGYKVGATYYTYTDNFDDDYIEGNLGFTWKYFSVEGAIGSYDNFDASSLDYTYLELGAEYEGWFAKYGVFGDDFDGDWFGAGYGLEVAGIDLSASWIYSDKDRAGGDSDNTIVLGLSKKFSII